MTGLELVAHASHEASNGGSAAVLSFALLLAASGIAGTYLADAPADFPTPPSRSLGDVSSVPRLCAAGGCLGAALIHAAVLGEHLSSSVLHGAFFVALAGGQLLLAAMLLRHRTPRVLRAGLATSALVVLLWLLSRSLGIAFVTGREPPGLLDAAATLLELGVIAGCGWTLRRASDQPYRRNRVPA